MGPVVRGVAAVIGLAREKHLGSQRGKAAKHAGLEDSVRDLDVNDFLHDKKDGPVKDVALQLDDKVLVKVDEDSKQSTEPERDEEAGLRRSESSDRADALPIYGSWELDEAQDEVAETASEVVQSKVMGNRVVVSQSEIPYLAEKFAETYPLQDTASLPRLDCSVIIPQRRPESRKRGFIRAYAPVLAAKGISEETFIDFIATFNIASQANPLLNAINMASFSAHALPPGIGIAVAEAIRLAVDTAIEAQSRYRANSFLDQINKLWFLPRGLVCFPMIWKPSVSSIVSSVAIDATAAEQSDKFKIDQRTVDKFKGGASTTRGNVQFPDAAPLIFPLLDDFFDDETHGKEGTMKHKLLHFSKTTNDYFDRRAQAKYTILNPNSGLSNLGVRPEFKSRYSDPSHPAASGSLLGLITGGAVSTHDWRLVRRQNQKGVVEGGANVTAVANFMRDIKLSSVIKTMRGKVSAVHIRELDNGADAENVSSKCYTW